MNLHQARLVVLCLEMERLGGAMAQAPDWIADTWEWLNTLRTIDEIFNGLGARPRAFFESYCVVWGKVEDGLTPAQDPAPTPAPLHSKRHSPKSPSPCQARLNMTQNHEAKTNKLATGPPIVDADLITIRVAGDKPLHFPCRAFIVASIRPSETHVDFAFKGDLADALYLLTMGLNKIPRGSREAGKGGYE